MHKNKAITLIGVNDDGCLSLSSKMVNAIANCQILAGGERQLEFFPDFGGEKFVLKSGLSQIIDQIVELSAESNVCVLASGDPMFFGIGALVFKKAGLDNVEVIPQPSSIQFAFAKAGLKWDDAKLLSLHGRPREGFITQIKRYRKIGCLTDANNSPAEIARYMLDYGECGWNSWVCENLSGINARVRNFKSLEELVQCKDISDLNVWILERTCPDWAPPSIIQNLNEDRFSKRIPRKGLITKKEVRLLTMGEMQIKKDSVIWDIGAASGSISIEAAHLAYEGRAYAIEVDEESIQCCRENLKTFALDNVKIIKGHAPEILDQIDENPDIVFIGGSKGSLGKIIQTAYQRLKSKGRLVVNVITLENIHEAYQTLKETGVKPNIIQLNISRGVPIARYFRYEALNPIHIFSVVKP
ncbi:MAG: precorrin-6y C5,15-methyltransferase (decarboxylating) subunit CbiE [Proteobacteria bacterium]|nr:precorrin-6y C5,15-methyltransferase (decarboxylating) subunit CbiE [Pseudomonadota bacterium]